jgi:hypothetical protein
MPPPVPRPAPRGHWHRSVWAWAAAILRRSVRGVTAAVVSAALLAAVTLSGPRLVTLPPVMLYAAG